MKTALVLILVLLIVTIQLSMAEKIRVATASNFSAPLRNIARLFEQQSGHKVTVISASTGKLYAQIMHGAPFDIFLSADSKRAILLEKENRALTNSRFTYAIGQLVLWSPRADYIDKHGNILQHKQLLQDPQFRYLAIANPKLAPYGRAAQETLTKLGLKQALQKKIVRGENISQTFQFVKSGNAQLGLIAYSQLKQPDKAITGSYWLIPEDFYSPIKQQSVLLNPNKASRQFYDFMKSPQSRQIIASFGYKLETDTTSHAQ